VTSAIERRKLAQIQTKMGAVNQLKENPIGGAFGLPETTRDWKRILVIHLFSVLFLLPRSFFRRHLGGPR
jgi:hypothetical protein